jgi:nucleoside 2-deoxyribosyltransferase
MEGIKIYLACPYSDPDPRVREERTAMVDRAAAYLMSLGFIVFSPISHSHRISRHLDNCLDHEWWLKQDAAWLEAADELWILALHGWDKSIGVAWERGFAKNCNLPEHILHWDVVRDWLDENSTYQSPR